MGYTPNGRPKEGRPFFVRGRSDLVGHRDVEGLRASACVGDADWVRAGCDLYRLRGARERIRVARGNPRRNREVDERTVAEGRDVARTADAEVHCIVVRGKAAALKQNWCTHGCGNRRDRTDVDSTEATAGDGDSRRRANLLTVLPDSAERNRVRTRLAIRVREGKRLCRGDVLALRCGRLCTVEIFIAPTYRECRVRLQNTADRHPPRARHAGLERRRAGDRSDTGRSERTEGIHRKRERIARLALPA